MLLCQQFDLFRMAGQMVIQENTLHKNDGFERIYMQIVLNYMRPELVSDFYGRKSELISGLQMGSSQRIWGYL